MHLPMIIGLPSGIQEKKCSVDSGASLHMMGSSSLKLKEKKTIRQSSKILDIQSANGIVVSDTQAIVLSVGTLCERFTVSAYVGRTML